MRNVVSDRVCTVIVITIAGEFALDLEVFRQALLIADRGNLRIADRRERVSSDG